MQRTTTPRETDLLKKAGQYMPGGSNGNTVTMDRVIRGGRGPRVWDLSGNEYVDYALGSGPMLIGHAHPEVVAAVSEQLSQGTTYFGLNEHAIPRKELIWAQRCIDDEVDFLFAHTGVLEGSLGRAGS